MDPLEDVAREQHRVVALQQHLQPLDRSRREGLVEHGQRERLRVRRQTGTPGLDHVGAGQRPPVEQGGGADLQLRLGVTRPQSLEVAVDGRSRELADVDLDATEPDAVSPLVLVDLGVDPLPPGVVHDRAALGVAWRAMPVDVDLDVGALVGEPASHRAGQQDGRHTVVGRVSGCHRLGHSDASVQCVHSRDAHTSEGTVVKRAAA